jgi:5-formyltetrahydrofolate cyclo-ligase
MTVSIQDEKRMLRASMKQRLASLSVDERSRESRRVADALHALAVFQQAKIVMSFLSLADEIDTAIVNRLILSSGRRLCVPRTSWPTRSMVAVGVDDLDDRSFQVDKHGIREPIDGEEVPAGKIDLVLVPGLAFDRQGRRLGRGAGFYDRWLSNSGFVGVALACGYDVQLLEVAPEQGHDVRVGIDLLINQPKS